MIIEVLLFVITVIIVSSLFKKNNNLPPGPWQLPVIGNLPVIYAEDCRKLQKKYGNIFMTRLGVVNMLFITDYKISKEAFNKMEFTDRMDYESLQILKSEMEQNEIAGVVFSNGARWHNSRRFLLRNLRDLGMGKSKLEDIILREIEILVEDFKSRTKEPSTLPLSINVTILNVIWQLVASQRYEYNDSELEGFMKCIEDSQKSFFISGTTNFFPFLKYIIPERLLNHLFDRNAFVKAGEDFTKLVQSVIDEHLTNLDPDNPIDLMDEYLIEMKYKKSPEYSHFTNGDLIRTTFDLFVAGNDTTAAMLRHFILYMAKFPHIQSKIQKEIDAVVPSGKLPGLEHREKLSYIDATINEIQRHCSLVPLGLMRVTNKDTSLEGYAIPKGTIVQSVAEIIHMDPANWKNPEEVDPTRFLDSNGKFIAQRDGFQPFGIGKRQCLGEQFARMEMFLIAAALLQNFTFSPPEEKEIDIKPVIVPIMNRPKEQALRIELRV